MGGPFLERDRILRSDSPEIDPVYVQAEDLYVGANIQIQKHNFILFDADEYALKFMEKNKDRVSLLLVFRSDFSTNASFY